MDELVYYYPAGHQAHFERGHPESPERVEAVCQGLERAGLWQPYARLEPLPLGMDFLERVHTHSYLRTLQCASQNAAHLDMDTYTTNASWQLALNAAGGAVAVAQAVWRGESQTGFALTRPPGHHATANRGMGFCLLNNIALAAEFLRTQPLAGAGNPQRLAIVDLDLHHGNGTQDIFWRRADVFYISTHQSPLYPGTGGLQEIGAGAGEGATANLPFPPGSGDACFRAAMQEIILPLLERFAPQMLLVSVGFDPHWRDPLGYLALSAGCYGELIAQLVEWSKLRCAGKVALFLEGGYDLQAGQACAQAWVSALLGQPWQDPIGPSLRQETSAWRAILDRAQQIWQLPAGE